MKPLLVKEIRLVLPAYVVALLLAIIPAWLLRSEGGSPATGTLFAFCFGAVMLALSSFGREFALQTFPLILAQPLNRNRIWWTKIAVLVTALCTLFAAWYLTCEASSEFGLDHSERAVLLVGGGAAIVMFAGALWSTLLLRQITAAFWFTLLIPGAMVMILRAIAGYFNMKEGSEALLFLSTLGLYSAAGFWWAQKQFLGAEEVAWTGGIITLGRKKRTQVEATSLRRRHPLAALFQKELQLHQVTLFGMAGLFVLHLGIVALRKFGYESFTDSTKSALNIFGGIWFIAPLIAGSPAIAEERKLGTMQEHLCLPISRRIQFVIKFLFVFVIGGVLSFFLFSIAEGTSYIISAGSDFVQLDSNKGVSIVGLFCLAFLGLSIIGFYASTLTRNVVQALAAAVVSVLALCMFFPFISRPYIFDHFLWGGSLAHYFAWPMLVVVFFWLAWRNFGSFAETSRLAWCNAGVLLSSFLSIIGLTCFVYHRAWELVMPLEPPHGPVRITGSKPTTLKLYGGHGITLLLPDGRLWVDRIAFDPGHIFLRFSEETGFRLGGKWIGLSGNRIAPGSNWVDAVANFQETVAIRSGGTLWVSEKPRHQNDYRWESGERPVVELESDLVQFGEEATWKQVVRDWSFESKAVLLLKGDGSIWRWSWRTNVVVPKEKLWRGLRAYEPHRLGTESDWRMIKSGAGIYAWKHNGSAWAIHPPHRRFGTNAILAGEIELEPGTMLERRPALDNTKWRSLTMILGCEVGLRENGTMWVWPVVEDDNQTRVSAQPVVQIGKDTDWRAVTGDFSNLVAVKNDGSLWQFKVRDTFAPSRAAEALMQLQQPPGRISTHSDWAAIGSAMGGTVALAADGNLWYWWDRSGNWYGNSDQPMLAPSRRPIKIENILGKEF